MKKSNLKYFFFIFLLILLCSFASAQKRLAVIKVRNNQVFFFKEGVNIQCTTQNAVDSFIIKHRGHLAIIDDSLIKIDTDTLKLKDITSIKKNYTIASKLSLSCLISYLGCSQIVAVPVGILTYFWAVSQGIEESYAAIAGISIALVGGYIINYYLISNSSFFKSFNKVGTKYKLSIRN